MPADKSSTLELAGVALGALTTSAATAYEWAFTVSIRDWAYINVYAIDASNEPIAFQWSNATAGTYNIVPAGMVYTLPVYQVQSYFFKRVIGDISLYADCAG